MIDATTGFYEALYATEESFFYREYEEEANNEDLYPIL